MTKIMFACALALAACGGGSKKPDTTTSNTDTTTTTTTDGSGAGSATGEGLPCEKEVAMVCPDGQIDGCLKQPAEGTTHACVAK